MVKFQKDNFHQTSILEIMKIIKNYKNGNSVGWDNISTNILKTNVMALAPIPSNLIFLIRWFLTATSGTKCIIVSAGHVYILLHQREKRGSTIQYGYRKWGTHARVFSQTLALGNSENEIRQRNRRRW